MSSSNRAMVRRGLDEATASANAWPLEDLAAPEPEPEPAPEEEAGPTPEELAVAEAERRARELEEARAQGYAEGLEEGRRTERARLEAAIRTAEQAADAVRDREQAILEALEENITVLAVTVARHIIGREVKADPEVVADLVRKALTEFPLDQPVRIRVNPADLSLISTVSADDGEPIAIGSGRDVRWLADPNVASGGCVVEGQDRIIDGRVDKTLERIYWKLQTHD